MASYPAQTTLKKTASQIVHIGSLTLDPQKQEVCQAGRSIKLTPTLFRLLHILMSHPHEPLSPAFLFREVWETSYAADVRTLQVHVCWLRKKIEEDPKHPRYLKTIRGIGYWFGDGEESHH